MRYVLVVLAVCLFPVLALAQAIPDPSTDIEGYLDLLTELWTGARWAPLVAVVVIGVVAALRRWGASLVPWFATRIGGLVLAVVGAVAVSAAHGLLTGLPVAQVVVNAVVAAVGAIGIHSGVKNAAQGNAPKPGAA